MNMELKNDNKKKIIFLVLTLIMCLGVSLAAVYFTYNYNDERQNILETALVSIAYSEGSESIFLENQVPVIDDIGLTNTPYEFTVQNTSKIPINIRFQIVPQDSNQIPLGAIRYGLYVNGELIKKSNVGTLEDNTLYMLENVKKGTTINVKLVFWVDYYYEKSGETFAAKIKVTGESFDIIYEETFVDTIKTKLGTGGLIAVNTDGDLYNSSDTTQTIREYRYSGPTANNYVFFDTNGNGKKDTNEIWRIIGVFKDTVKDENGNIIKDASGNPNYEEKVKLVRNTILQDAEMPTTYLIDGISYMIKNSGYTYWNYVPSGTYPSTNKNDWTTAGLQYYLNTEADETDTSDGMAANAGYLSLLSNEAKEMISTTTYYLGNVSYDGDTPKSAYTNERDETRKWIDNQASWNGMVGMMYPSDYGYSASNLYWETDMYGWNSAEEDGVIARSTSWLYQTANHNNTYEWLLSPSSDSSGTALSWDNTGDVTSGNVEYTIAGRPVLNLKSEAMVLDAEGTLEDPYVVKVELPNGVNLIKGKVVSHSEASSSDFSGGLVAVNTDGDLYNSSDTTQTIREYRYSGPTANNYVYFDTNGDGVKDSNEIWRVVGVFKDTVKDEEGNVVNDASGNPTYEEEVKLVRNTILTADELPESYLINGTTYTIASGTTSSSAYWNKKASGTNNNDWTTAGLQYYLNTEKDETDTSDGTTTANAGYLSLLTNEAKELISPTTYYLGDVKYGSSGETPKSAYVSERWSENQATWDGLIGMMYQSDYGYSASNLYWETDMYGWDETESDGVIASDTSWMHLTMTAPYGWLLSPSYYGFDFAMSWYSRGSVTFERVYIRDYGVRPVLNLKSEAMVLDAEGTEESPYVVVIE